MKLKDDEIYCPFCKRVYNRKDGHDCWERRMSDGSEFMEEK